MTNAEAVRSSESAQNRNIIVTGIPRSGTTLVCWLLTELPGTVALAEPAIGWRFWLSRDPVRASEHVGRFFKKTRDRILTRRTAPSAHIAGKVPTNPFEEQRRGSRLRRSRARFGTIRIEKDLAPDFWLVVKHPAPFTVILEGLVQRFPSYAVIRNPLAVLAAWNSVVLPVNWGHLLPAEWFDPSFRRALSRISDRFDRQFYILAWFFETYRRVLPSTSILRYEDIVESGGRVLGTIIPEAAHLSVPLQSRNTSPLYDASLMRVLGERLLKTEGPYWHFYSRESVESLLRQG